MSASIRSAADARPTGLALSAILMWALIVAWSSSARAASPAPKATLRPDALILANGRHTLLISLRSPEFVFDGQTVGGGTAVPIPKADILRGKLAEISCPQIRLADGTSLDVRLFLRWSARERVLRKWSSYRVTGASTQLLLREIVLDRLDLSGGKVEFHPWPPQSHPAFWNGFFAGVEFPVASSRLENGRFILAHQPGLRLKNGVWYETRRAVYGIAPEGKEERAFLRYIELNRPTPKGLHINYESWWSTPVPLAEADTLKLMSTLEEKLYKPYGAYFDSYCITLGWSDLKSIWKIDKRLFPDGFTKVQAAARRIRSNLGLWVSPSSFYSSALDNEWAHANGYETFPTNAPFQSRIACLAGIRYRTALKDQLVGLVTKYGIRHLKIDGYVFECPESTHGHEPGPLSAEPIAEAMISVLSAIHRASPKTWLEPTCFQANASPWWLFHSNSVTGFYGDDAVYGVVPCPVYRESYTSARDRFNLQGAALLNYPVTGQDLMGIVHQSPEPFMNDAVITIMRGNMFIQPYVNPRFVNERRWKALGGLMNWLRKNAPALEETQPLLPASWERNGVPNFSYTDPMPREPYGYAHWGKNRGLVALRNPWIAPCERTLKLDEAAGFERDAAGVSAVSLYPEVRVYARNLKFGDKLDVPLAPYETVVLSISAGQSVAGLPKASEAIGKRITATVAKSELAGRELRLQADITVTAPQAQLLILLEGKKAAPEKPVCRISVNGKDAVVETRASIATYHMPDENVEIGWAASILTPLENWRFIVAGLEPGRNRVSVEMLAGDDCSRVSAWVWATKPGNADSSYPNVLPAPEVLSLDAAEIVPATEVSGGGQARRPTLHSALRTFAGAGSVCYNSTD